MNIVDFSYFIAAAEHENMNKAAKDLGVSPATLSRSVGKLEAEYNTELFSRIGKNIVLNERGKSLLTHARAILERIQSIKHELTYSPASAAVNLSGRAVLMTKVAPLLTDIWTGKLNLTVRYKELFGAEAIESVLSGKSNFCITTQRPPAEFFSVEIFSFRMVACYSKLHPMSKKESPIPVKSLLQFDFVAPQSTIFGELNNRASPDGWNDHAYPRKITQVTDSLPVIEELCRNGKVLAFLPDYRAAELNLNVAKVSGYNLENNFKVFLGMRKVLQAPHVLAAFEAIKAEFK